MAIKVGLIDYYLDEWHANNYADFFRKWAPGLEVCSAWAKIDSPLPGGLTTQKWSETYGVPVRDTMEEVIAEADVLIVLSPDNPEMHEELCQKPLASGKRTYIDKTFAETKASAERIFAMAEAGNTPCYTTSALFFAEEYQPCYGQDIKVVDSCGPGKFPIYVIHQLEPIVNMLRAKPERAISVGTESHPMVIVEFEGGKRAKLATFAGGGSFAMTVGHADGKAVHVDVATDFWHGFVVALEKFFRTGEIPVPRENTINVIWARELCFKALEKPFEWVEA